VNEIKGQTEMEAKAGRGLWPAVDRTVKEGQAKRSKRPPVRRMPYREWRSESGSERPSLRALRPYFRQVERVVVLGSLADQELRKKEVVMN